MMAASAATERRRPRPGSLERPVNGRLYRGAWLLVVLPLLLLAFSVSSSPSLGGSVVVPAFDGPGAAALAQDLAARYPHRIPGTADATGAQRWFRRELVPYGFDVRRDAFTATINGRKT